MERVQKTEDPSEARAECNEDSDAKMSTAEENSAFPQVGVRIPQPPSPGTAEIIAFQALSSLSATSTHTSPSRGYPSFLPNRNHHSEDPLLGSHSHSTNLSRSTSSAMEIDKDKTTETEKKSPKKFTRVKIACSACKASKTKCDLERPCWRCHRLGRGHEC